ncbi:putative oxidoreductase [Sinosporangium album]|uniref:Putative oxidoreductase n=1 Tax=Sinosporangium album TaxID=504805 RepID=A0A1G8L9P8_9ACTN|nr:DoxX family protein [Sinosporangium album]SDI52381.1 putative oxidoreductase [Sinosporangium album]
MDIGLFLLRVLLAVLLFGHGAQKMFGWFGGLGPEGTGALFAKWGLKPGRQLVLLAAACEILAALLLGLGLLTPFAAAMAAGTLLVAVWVSTPNGVWAVKGGYELPLTYSGIALALAFTGPGAIAVDRAAGLTDLSGVAWGVAAVVAAVVPAAGFAAYTLRNRRTTNVPQGGPRAEAG